MTDERYQLLVEANFQFVTVTVTSWYDNFDILKSILRPDGSVDYSGLSLDDERRMKNFVMAQRKDYRRRENKEKSPMTDERYQLLVEANFQFVGSRTGKKKKSS